MPTKPKPKRLPSSPEQKAEARRRYERLAPLTTTELDSLLRWAERSYQPQMHSKSPGPPPEASEVKMLVIRLLFAGRELPDGE